MIKFIHSLKKYQKHKSRSLKPSLETIPENKVLYSSTDVKKNEIINTVFMNDHWSLPNKKD
tara:strand:- start:222 stop:404 length:183 start_codon:yes stop_codon:yes gene_type:complete